MKEEEQEREKGGTQRERGKEGGREERTQGWRRDSLPYFGVILCSPTRLVGSGGSAVQEAT